MHPHQQRADHPAIDFRHAAIALGGVEEFVRAQYTELLRGQANQHFDDERRMVVFQGNDGLQVQREFVFLQRRIDESEQLLFAGEDREIAREFVVVAVAVEAQRRDDGGVARAVLGLERRIFDDEVARLAQRLGEHRQHGCQLRHARRAVFFTGSEARERDQHHATEGAAVVDGERTTCAGGICALPPQAAVLPAHVGRFGYIDADCSIDSAISA